MKRLIMVNGTMGVGKTSTCRALLPLVEPAAFLDGDWCWTMSPFIVNDETKAMVLDNIACLLNRFLACSQYQTVIFCWVMQQQEILDEVLRRLSLEDVAVSVFTLTATEEALRARLGADIAAGVRQPDILERSCAYLPLYQGMDTIPLDVSDLTPQQAAQWIAEHAPF